MSTVGLMAELYVAKALAEQTGWGDIPCSLSPALPLKSPCFPLFLALPVPLLSLLRSVVYLHRGDYNVATHATQLNELVLRLTTPPPEYEKSVRRVCVCVGV